MLSLTTLTSSWRRFVNLTNSDRPDWLALAIFLLAEAKRKIGPVLGRSDSDIFMDSLLVVVVVVVVVVVRSVSTRPEWRSDRNRTACLKFSGPRKAIGHEVAPDTQRLLSLSLSLFLVLLAFTLAVVVVVVVVVAAGIR